MRTSNLRGLGCALVLGLTSLSGCSEDATERDGGVDGGTDTVQPAEGGGATGALKGLVADADGKPIGDATVSVGALSTTANFKGEYELQNVPAGDVTVAAVAAWFAEKQQAAAVKAGETTQLDLTLDPLPLKIEDDDRALAEQYNSSYDWTSDALSVVIVESPTRREVENAIFFRNPALHRDTSAEDPVTPGLSIDGSGGAGFDFPVTDKQALDATTIVDSLADTPVPADVRGRWSTWDRMLKVVKGWNLEKAVPLNSVGAAVRQQQWGGDGVQPQEIEQVWIHGSEIWVSVVFESFVQVGGGISDTDGDGRKEVFARVAAAHYDQEVIDQINSAYVEAGKLSTLQLKGVIDDVVNDLYDVSNPEIVGTLGQPFEVAGHGELRYPFVVLKHANEKQNVLLVGP